MTCQTRIPEKFEQLSESDAVNMSDSWYQYTTADHFWMQWRFSVLRELLQKVALGERILEVGCGSAVASQQIEAEFDVAVDGCDLNPTGMRLAEPGRGNLYLYNIHDRRPEWENAFDTIFLLDTLEHIDEPVEFLRSVAFHLQKDGIIVLNVPALNFLYSRYDEVVGHVKRYDKKTMKRELAEAGLSLDRHRYWGITMLPVVLARKVMASFLPQDRVCASGIDPSKSAEFLLRCLMAAEQKLIRSPWAGSSLAGVARLVRKAEVKSDV